MSKNKDWSSRIHGKKIMSTGAASELISRGGGAERVRQTCKKKKKQQRQGRRDER